jgi:alkanesulfonate monooxygenase SsuD/methylene tetrahydromethanopterin reductase-like flavin-dependent oxidoreductase (luciferase family)
VKAEVGICLFPSGRTQETVRHARLCEALGLAFVGIGDVPSLWRDVYVTSALIAAGTDRIRLGPWVTNPVTRHPSVTANAILSLHDISEGRAFLGVGVGDGAVAPIGRAPATLDAMARAVSEMRDCFRAAGERIRIYWAAAGPRSLARAAETSDGVIVSGWITPEVMERTHDAIREGLARGCRGEGEVELIFHTAISVGGDRRQAIEAAKPYVARALARSSSTWLPDWTERDMAEQGVAALVPDDLVPRKAVAGSPEECLELLARIRSAGFDRIALIPLGDVETVLHTLGSAVLPHL